MPGIPGTSKACTTCKRRKIRCDLGVPFCGRCIRSNRLCEGYARHPVFLNQTAQGADKRHKLQEARTRRLTGPVQAVVSAHDGRQTLAALAGSEDNRMLSQLSATPAFDSQIIALFFERYLPASKASQDRCGRGWLQEAIGLQNPGEALHLSLKAMSMKRLGRSFKEERMIFQGEVLYGSALQQLQKALQSKVSIWRDETIAAGFILALYELFESESAVTSIEAWGKHMSGLEQLVIMRGPQLSRSQFGHELLEDIRSSLMISCVTYRRTSVLAYGRWLARPWDETSHSVHPRVYDKGFALAALFQDLDNANVASFSTNISTLSLCLQRLIDMDTDLESWYEEYLVRNTSPLYWPAQPSTTYTRFERKIADSGPRGLPLLAYPNLTIASTTLTFWALKILLSDEIANTSHIILSTNHKARTDARATDPAASLKLISMAQIAEKQHSKEKRMDLATDISRSVPYCLNSAMGLLGPERALFALRTAIAMFRRHPGPELECCRKVYLRFNDRSGFRGAMQLHPYLYGPYQSR